MLPTYVAPMREAFHDQLGSIFDDLAAICSQVEEAVASATEALLQGDAEIAERVISADIEIDRARERVEDKAFSLLSLQAPVAGDLRVVVAALRMVTELERMGDLSVHVAKIARLRVPNIAVPEEIRPTVSRMAVVAEDMVHRVHEIITSRDVGAAIALGRDDEEMDQLRRRSFTELLSDRLDPRRRGRGRRGPARPLLRADRRPRRLGGQPGGLRRHRREPGRRPVLRPWSRLRF